MYKTKKHLVLSDEPKLDEESNKKHKINKRHNTTFDITQKNRSTKSKQNI